MKIKKIAVITLAILIITITIAGIANAKPPENPLEFNEGLVLSGNDFDYHTINNNKTIHFHAFDQKTGNMIPDEELECHHHLFQLEPDYEDISSNGNFTVSDYGITLNIPGTSFDNEGTLGINIRCNTTQTIDGEQVEKGGYARYDFKVREYISTSTKGKMMWTCPVDWTFPILFMIITLILISVGITQQSMIFGILGSIMLLASYLYIGACSPLFLSPLLIISILLMIKFASGEYTK